MPPIALLAVVQLAHGLTFGLTMVGTMGLMVRHVPDSRDGAGAGVSGRLHRHGVRGRIDHVGHDLSPAMGRASIT